VKHIPEKENIRITIDDEEVICPREGTVLQAAREAGIYIPTLCAHPDLNPSGSCRLCIVEIEGVKGFPTSCTHPVSDGMKVFTATDTLRDMRRDVLSLILERHPHACLNCAQREGCTREPCSTNVPVDERCCPLFGNCELQRITEYLGMREDTPKYVPGDLPVVDDEPLYKRDRNLCILCGRCVAACTDLRGTGVLGFIERGHESYVGTAFGRSHADSDCSFCGACVEVCPTGALTDRDLRSGVREEVLVPCRHNCPAGIDVPRFINLVERGRFESAAAVIREALPLPETLGHICLHPCETECRRGLVNEAISIRELHRFAASRDDGEWRSGISRAGPTGKKVAVVGSGPSGLTAACFLALKGHDVTVFERSDRAGGALRELIPEYRLPEAVLEREIRVIEDMGVEFRTGTAVDSLAPLKNDGYDAVYLAVGSGEPLPLPVPGREAEREGEDENVVPALVYLREANSGKGRTARRVAVVGAGHALVESARTAVRLGASEVHVLTESTEEDFGKYSGEMELGREEGIEFTFDTGLEGMERTPDGELRLNCSGPAGGGLVTDMVVHATGSRPLIPEGLGVRLDESGRIMVDPGTLSTGIDGVYAGGDAVSAGRGAVEAVEAGKKAAGSIDIFLGGNGDLQFEPVEGGKPDPHVERIEGFAYLSRERPETPRVEERISARAPDSLVFPESTAGAEAKRCLRCNLRLCLEEVPRPPEIWLEFNEENVSTVPAAEGVYQLLDGEKTVIAIKGTGNLLDELREKLDSGSNASYFVFEEDKMYSQRENELLQVYMQKHGRMPEGEGGEDDLDDLF
jgi:NADPH-dependent glutamate synthase beta subunit-like oxidoreductase